MTKRLTLEEQLELGRKIQQGDKEARKRFIETYIPFVVYVTKKRLKIPDYMFEDAVSEGLIGLVESVDTYDPELGYTLNQHAFFQIRAAIWRMNSKIVHLGRTASYSKMKIRQFIDEYYKTNGKEPTSSEILEALGKKLGISRETTIKKHSSSLKTLSIQNLDVHNTGWLVDNTEYIDSKKETDKKYTIRKLHEELKALPEQEEYIIKSRFGIGKPKKTLEELGDELGVSRETIRTRQAKAEKTLYERLKNVIES